MIRAATSPRRRPIKDELGDVLWYVAVLAGDLGLSLDQIARDNLAKLNRAWRAAAWRRRRRPLGGAGELSISGLMLGVLLAACAVRHAAPRHHHRARCRNPSWR